MHNRELVCIVCPVGCSLTVEEGDTLAVMGNRCPRGAAYAQEEIQAPKRTVTATCAIINDDAHRHNAVRRIPVKTNIPCPKEKIPALLEDIYRAHITLPAKAGDIIIANWNNSGIDVVVTRTIRLV